MNPKCPGCKSSELEERTSIQHDRCGCIRPKEAFTITDADNLSCPQCRTRECSTEFSTVGEFYVCPDCLQRYEPRVLASESSNTAHGPQPAEQSATASESTTEEQTLLSILPNWNLWMIAVLMIAIITFSSMVFPPAVLSAQSSLHGGEPLVKPTLSGSNAPTQGGSGVSNTFSRGVPASSNYEPPDSGTYDTIVVYRNDDVQPNYEPAALQNVTELFAETGTPLTQGVLGTTPPNASVCQYMHRLTEKYPRQFEVALHGYNHKNLLTTENNDTRYQLSEFAGSPYQMQQQRIQQGTSNVTQCTAERPTTFVPPFDTYDNTTVRALNASGYTAISGGTWFYNTNDSIFTYGDLVHVGYVTNPSLVQLYYNYSQSPPSAHSVTSMKRAFDNAYRNHSLFLFTIHYNHLTTEKDLKRLRTFIEYQQSKDIAFMTVGDLAKAFRQDRLQRTEGGWVFDKRNSSTSNGTTTTAQKPSTAPIAMTSVSTPDPPPNRLVPRHGPESVFRETILTEKQGLNILEPAGITVDPLSNTEMGKGT